MSLRVTPSSARRVRLGFYVEQGYVSIRTQMPPNARLFPLISNYIYNRVKADLTKAGKPDLLAPIENFLKGIHPTLGPAEVLLYSQYLQSIDLLSDHFPRPQCTNITMEHLNNFLLDVANNLLFPQGNISWEGITMLLRFTANFIVESRLAGIPGGREFLVLTWMFKVFSQSSDPDEQHLHSWIMEQAYGNLKGWQTLCALVDHLLYDAVVPQFTSSFCNCCNKPVLLQRDLLVDPGFPFAYCGSIFWCTIHNCIAYFKGLQQLMVHQARCHKYPYVQDFKQCKCGEEFDPDDQNFVDQFKLCSQCDRRTCSWPGCDKSLKTDDMMNRHLTSKHPDPFMCQKCKISTKPRDGKDSYARCPQCDSTFWCLRGFCPKEFDTYLGLSRHQSYLGACNYS